MARALSMQPVVDVVVAQIASQPDPMSAFRETDAPEVMKLVSDRLGSLLGVGESMHVIDLQRMALLRTADLDGTEKRCRRLLVEMRKPIEWSAGRSLVPDVALGVVRAGAGITAARLLRQARVTLEVAKLEGPGCVIRHREAVDDFLKLRRELRAEFPQALDRGAVGLAFEPVVCLHTGAIIGGRTQPRWLHPRLGAVTPEEIWSLARETGSTHEMDCKIVAVALHDLRTALPPGQMLPVTLALSGAAMTDAFFAERLRDACARTGLPKGLIRLEVSLPGPSPHQDVLGRRLAELNDAGIELVIEDIHRWNLPIGPLLGLRLASVECDVRWLMDQSCEPGASRAPGGLVRVAHALGGKAGAWGAATVQDLAVLREFRFDHVRGPACGPALSIHDLVVRARTPPSTGPRIDPFSI